MVNLINDRSGWLRVLEASIAILIVLSVLFVVTKQNNIGKEVPAEEIGILEQISMNNSMREVILDYNLVLKEDEGVNAVILKRIRDFVSEKLPPGYGYEIKICSLESCELENDNLEMISEERILSASISNVANPVKIKLVYWQE